MTVTVNVCHELKGTKKQDAAIYFSNGIFMEVIYHVENLKYTANDWKFLGDIAELVARLIPIEKKNYEAMINAIPAELTESPTEERLK